MSMSHRTSRTHFPGAKIARKQTATVTTAASSACRCMLDVCMMVSKFISPQATVVARNASGVFFSASCRRVSWSGGLRLKST